MKRLGVRPLKLIVHNNVSAGRRIPAKRKVHSVPLDDTLMVLADDFLLPALALELALGAPDELLEELLVSCPEISKKDKERVCGELIFMTRMAETVVVSWMNTYTAGRWVTSSSSPYTAVSC
jgi:hypothetical protein